ncbi:MAG TPA: DEAD/DEAH box helicase, partial [Conexibacter sp.]|nr:DEAD/DEAH box helicase [Conexibacter sp.]
RANVVLTNPDMLHVGILPNHRAWGDFLSNLAVVVVDEAHVYRGVFGSHMGNVLRRLRRIAARSRCGVSPS